MAEEVTTIAEGTENPDAKRMMLGVAHDYLTLAKSAQHSAETSKRRSRADGVPVSSSAEVAVHST
jgi:hypothetical protein